MTGNKSKVKKSEVLEALKQVFPDQDIKIIISKAVVKEEQKIEVLKAIDSNENPLQALLGLGYDYLKNVCRKPRRAKIMQILLDNPGISFKEIKEIYNHPTGETGKDTISNGSLFEHLNILVLLGYVLKDEGWPAKYQIAPRTEAIRKIAAVAKALLIKKSLP